MAKHRGRTERRWPPGWGRGAGNPLLAHCRGCVPLLRPGAACPVPAPEPRSAPEPSRIAGAFPASAAAAACPRGQGWARGKPRPRGAAGGEPPAGTPAPPQLPALSQFLFAYWAPSLPHYAGPIRQLPAVPGLGSAQVTPVSPPGTGGLLLPWAPRSPPGACHEHPGRDGGSPSEPPLANGTGLPAGTAGSATVSPAHPCQLCDGRAGVGQGTPREAP